MPPACCRYLEQNRQQPDLPVTEARFVVLDTEATGLNTAKDRILSIGAVAVRHPRIFLQDSFELLVAQEATGSSDTIKVHGILQADMAGAVSEAEALEQLLDYLGNSVVVAHNLWFDKSILDRALLRQFGFPLLNPSLDTINLARRLQTAGRQPEEIPGKEFTLEKLCQQYGIRMHYRHSAAGDALATAELLQILLAKAGNRGITRLKQLAG